jgi:hypothetical protein
VPLGDASRGDEYFAFITYIHFCTYYFNLARLSHLLPLGKKRDSLRTFTPSVHPSSWLSRSPAPPSPLCLIASAIHLIALLPFFFFFPFYPCGCFLTACILPFSPSLFTHTAPGHRNRCSSIIQFLQKDKPRRRHHNVQHGRVLKVPDLQCCQTVKESPGWHRREYSRVSIREPSSLSRNE